jgi:tetratricopeptide (TPR) repeat protein
VRQRPTLTVAITMRYESRATIAMGSIVVLAAIGFIGLRGAMAPPMRAFPLTESSDSFVVRDPQLIQPDSSAYARFADEDAAWRRKYADPRALTLVTNTSSGSIWRPSARQSLDDQVYQLSRRGRLDDAIALLDAWVARHPRDGDELLKLARLLNQAGHGDASVERYRQLLALETAGRK